MNCWLIGVTLQCLGSNDLTFIQNRNMLNDQPARSSVVEYPTLNRTVAGSSPAAPANPRNEAYVTYLRACTAKGPANLTVIHRCIDGYKP